MSPPVGDDEDVDSDGDDPRVRQQEAVAALGRQAIQTDADDLDRLLHDAAAAVAEALNAEYGTVFERSSAGDELLVRAGVGWDDGVVGAATVPAAGDSQFGRALRSADPVVVDDRGAEERSAGPDLLADRGVASGISVVVGSVAEPWGVLGVHATDRREFSENDATFVRNVANVLAAAIDRAGTQRRLRERERALERYRAYTDDLLDAIDDVFYVVDRDGDLRRWNEAVPAVTGYADAEIESMNALDFFAEPDRETVANAIAEGFETGWVRVEADVETDAGETIPFEFVATGLTDLDGDPVLVGVGRDVSRREERDRELAKYEKIVGTIQDGIYAVDERGTYTMVNDAFCELTGYSREALLGEHATLVVDEETLERAAAVRAEMADDETASPTLETTVETAGGGRVPTEVTFATLPGDNGEERVGVVRDVTERKEQRRKLEASERRYRTLVEHFPNGAVAMFDGDLEYTAVGGQLLQAEGVDPADRIGRSILELYPDHLLDEVQPYFEVALEGEANSFEVEFAGRHVLGHTVPVRDADDAVYAGMLVVQDVTERSEYRRRLEESNERLEQFAYAASHDLQEPLRMVSSYLQLVERRYADDLDADGREFLDYAVDGADRMRDMITGLLEYSRVETQGDPFEPVDLDDVIADVRRDLGMKIAETDATVATETVGADRRGVDADPETGTLPRVEGDEGQLRQLFQNLLDNAIEYSGEGPPTISVTAERAGDRWEISVSDEGIGIDVADPERVFEVFESLHPSDEHAGTGIGLALCERIVERHGGVISVASEPGEGATFTFTLPAVDE